MLSADRRLLSKSLRPGALRVVSCRSLSVHSSSINSHVGQVTEPTRISRLSAWWKEPAQSISVFENERTTPRQVYGIAVSVADYSQRGEAWSNFKDSVGNVAKDVAAELSKFSNVDNRKVIELLNKNAKRGRVERAFEEITRQIGPDDVFVFFFSGHGNRIQEGDHETEGAHETIERYDGSMTEDELVDLLASTGRVRGSERTGPTVVVLDSCPSGGFWETINGRSKRVLGLFATSSAFGKAPISPGKWEPGFMAMAFLDALRKAKYVDQGGDGTVNVGELRAHVEAMYEVF